MTDLKFYEYSITKKPKYLVILLHGYGANGENLITLGHEFSPVLPDAHFISPNAIEPWEGEFYNSYQWFSLYKGFERKSLLEISSNIVQANKILKKFIEKQLLNFSLNYENLILIGFSQGAMMANFQGMINKNKIAGVLSYSGKIIEPTIVGEEINSKSQTCLIHGKQDSVLPFENFLEAKEILTKLKIPFEAHAIDNLDHSIDIRAVRIGQQFIKSLI